MSKTTLRRAIEQRYMRRRLSLRPWEWIERDTLLSDDDRAALRHRAANHSVPCSCYWCRGGRVEAAKHKAAIAPSAADYAEVGG